MSTTRVLPFLGRVSYTPRSEVYCKFLSMVIVLVSKSTDCHCSPQASPRRQPVSISSRINARHLSGSPSRQRRIYRVSSAVKALCSVGRAASFDFRGRGTLSIGFRSIVSSSKAALNRLCSTAYTFVTLAKASSSDRLESNAFIMAGVISGSSTWPRAGKTCCSNSWV